MRHRDKGFKAFADELEFFTNDNEAMKETPILFSTEMVQAILAGRKRMTRRVIKAIPENADEELVQIMVSGHHAIHGHLTCPYGKPGDRLWVREAWRPLGYDCEDYPNFTIEYQADKSTRFGYFECEKDSVEYIFRNDREGIIYDDFLNYKYTEMKLKLFKKTDVRGIAQKPKISIQKERYKKSVSYFIDDVPNEFSTIDELLHELNLHIKAIKQNSKIRFYDAITNE